jgi:F-type H+-transporting ATPase subunit epsilon
MSDKLLEVLVATTDRVLYEGKAASVILPGEHGVFEVLAYHKAIISRLLPGKIFVDGSALQIRRGVMKAAMNKVTVMVEEAA